MAEQGFIIKSGYYIVPSPSTTWFDTLCWIKTLKETFDFVKNLCNSKWRISNSGWFFLGSKIHSIRDPICWLKLLGKNCIFGFCFCSPASTFLIINLHCGRGINPTEWRREKSFHLTANFGISLSIASGIANLSAK